MPTHFASDGLQAGQIAVGPQSVEQFTLHGGRGSGGGKIWLLFRIAHLAQAGGPNPFTVLDGKGPRELVVQPLVGQQVKALGDYGGRRVTGADVGHLPAQLRPILWPLREQAGFLGNSVSRSLASLRPRTKRRTNEAVDNRRKLRIPIEHFIGLNVGCLVVAGANSE